MQYAKTMFPRVRLMLATCTVLALAAGSARAQLAPNQTHGFGNGRLVTFTYLQNFDCVDQPTMDLDRNGLAAQSDPNEMQTPICQVVTESTADPSGADIKHTAHLYVLVPMFSVFFNSTLGGSGAMGAMHPMRNGMHEMSGGMPH